MNKYHIEAKFPNGALIHETLTADTMIAALDIFRGIIAKQDFFIMNATRLEIIFV